MSSLPKIRILDTVTPQSANGFIEWNSLDIFVIMNPFWSDSQRAEAEAGLRAIIHAHHKALAGHVIFSTSGTTPSSAGSKWVALSQFSFLHAAQEANEALRVTSEDTWIQALPEHHVGGMAIQARAFLAEIPVIPWRKSVSRWSAELFHNALTMPTEGDRLPTLSSLVPAQVFDLVRLGIEAPSNLRAVLVGGGRLSNALYERAVELNWPLLPSFGMTELASQIATAPLTTIRSPKMPGMEFLKHIEARLSSDGLLEIRSPALFSAYLFPQASQLEVSERLIPAQDGKASDGWFQSQDQGEILQQGKTFVPLGRRTDEIKISGELVRLEELDMVLEECVLEQNFRHEVALALCPDMRMEFSIALAVAGGVNSEAQELMNCFNSRVMSHEKIREVHAVDRIPRTDLGKLIRHRIELKPSSKPL